jgi:hypothetical protein
MADSIVASHVARSNLPSSEKSAILRYLGGGFSRARHFGSRGLSHAGMFARATHKSAPVRTAIGVGVGGTLAALHVKLPQGLDVRGKAPADLIGSLGFMLLAMGARRGGMHGLSHHAETISVAAGSVFGFRKGVDLLTELERRKGRVPGGRVPAKGAAATHRGEGRDPLAAFAETL